MTPKVFISYSWSSPGHEEWVINLAQRLVSDGIDVVFDKWDLKEGNDLYDFMESMVKSSEINNVIIISDEKYSRKADSRKGGVGAEAQIISPEIYNNVSQEKFIPVVTEKDGEGKAFLPSFLKSRLYIDFSEDERFEENYEKLLRNIYNRPSLSKPQIGSPPSYIFEETPLSFKTTHIVRNFDSLIIKNPERINGIIRDFLEEYFRNIKEFVIKFTATDPVSIGKAICDNINQYTPLRNDFINFINKILRSGLEFDYDIITRFLEELTSLLTPIDERGGWSDYEFANFKFIIHEIFLYIIVLGLKNENYDFLDEIINSTYFSKDKLNTKREGKSLEIFYGYNDIINSYYSETYSKNFVSPFADLIIKRIPDIISKSEIVQADLLCCYVATLNNQRWFPATYIYDTSGKYEFFYRMESMRYFNKVKGIFNVNDLDEFKGKLKEYEEKGKNTFHFGYPNFFHSVPKLNVIVDAEKIGTKR